MGFAIPRSPLESRMDPRWLELHGTFKAMDVAKPFLSVAGLVNKGWEVCFKPGISYMKFQDTTIPLEERGGVYKIPLNLEGFQGHCAG